MADQSGEPPNSHLPVDPFRGDLVEYLVGNRGHDQPADHCDCRPYRSRVPMNPLTTRCADRLS
jgi:hypothetical protein